jgi:CHAT domain-containing protein
MSKAQQLSQVYLRFLLHSNDSKNHLQAWLVSEQVTHVITQKIRQLHLQGLTNASQSIEYETLTNRLKAARLSLMTAKSENPEMQQKVDELQERAYTHQRAQNPREKKTYQVMSLPQVMKKLPQNALLLRYLKLGQQYFLFSVTQSKWQLHKLDNGLFKQLDQIIKSEQTHLTGEQGYDLYSNLLPKNAVQRGTKHLIIIPDGQLFSVPFSTLRDESNQTYLAEKYTLVNALSASLFTTELTDIRPSDIGGMTIFSDPNFDAFNNENSDNSVDLWYSQFQRLPWTAQTADQLTQLFKNWQVQHFTGQHATSSALLQDSTRKAKLLHIATHAYYNKDAPENVGLITANTGINSDKRNRFVSLHDILDKPYFADLVVISACETQMGKHYSGEGMQGLAKVMLMQGVGSVIGTLWKVPDRATAKFMLNFYGALQENGGNIAKALQTARVAFIRSGRYKHPKYWAGFVFTVANSQYETIDIN